MIGTGKDPHPLRSLSDWVLKYHRSGINSQGYAPKHQELVIWGSLYSQGEGKCCETYLRKVSIKKWVSLKKKLALQTDGKLLLFWKIHHRCWASSWAAQINEMWLFQHLHQHLSRRQQGVARHCGWSGLLIISAIVPGIKAVINAHALFCITQPQYAEKWENRW